MLDERSGFERFHEWWPAAARVVLAGAHGGREQRRRAIDALLPLARGKFAPAHASLPALAGSEAAQRATALCRQLASIDEARASRVKDHWCTAIKRVVNETRAAVAAHDDAEAALARRRDEYLAAVANAFSTPEGRRLADAAVREEWARALELLRGERAASVERAKARIALDLAPLGHDGDDGDACARQSLRGRLRDVWREMDGVDRERVQTLYADTLRQIDHDMAERVAIECRSHWLAALLDRR